MECLRALYMAHLSVNLCIWCQKTFITLFCQNIDCQNICLINQTLFQPLSYILTLGPLLHGTLPS